MPEQQKVTVGLICYEEKERLSHTLKSLAEQIARHKIGEVLLVQNGTCKRTLAVARSFLKQLPLTILPHPVNHIGRARALIVRRAAFPLLAFTDGDCAVPPDWLKTLLLNWESCKAASPAGVGGPNRLPEKFFWQKTVNLSLCHPLGHGWSPQAHRPKTPRSVFHLPTTNALFSLAKIKTAGNFSEKCHPAGEDLELGRRLRKIGPLYLFPHPTVINDCADTYFQYLKRLFRFGRVRWKNKDKLFAPAFLFAPGFCLFFILGFYHFIFHAVLAGYFVVLILSAFQMYFTSAGGDSALKKPPSPPSVKTPSPAKPPAVKKKSRARSVFLFFPQAPVWFLQHFTYSLGVVFGFFRR